LVTTTARRFALDRDILPGESTTLDTALVAPSAPGQYAVRYLIQNATGGWIEELADFNVTIR